MAGSNSMGTHEVRLKSYSVCKVGVHWCSTKLAIFIYLVSDLFFLTLKFENELATCEAHKRPAWFATEGWYKFLTRICMWALRTPNSELRTL